MNPGQVLIIGFDGTEMSPRLAALLQKIQPAGVILFARNILGAEQTRKLLADCQKCVSIPLFTCIDLEGGKVDRFRNVLGSAPAPADVFATRNRKLFRKHGRIIGNNCRALGFNVDFAPALDLALPESHSVLGSRAVSQDPRQVVAYAREFLRGLSDSRILGCGKHFPGLGEANLDTHHDLPSVNKPFRKIWEQDLAPYRALKSELPFVMVSHAAFPSITKERLPASLSQKWISDILRKKVGYRGLVCSDDLEMGGVLAAAPIEEALMGHIRARGDVGLICRREDFIRHAYDALLRTIEKDRKLASRVAESSRRVLSAKKRWFSSMRTPALDAAKIERLTRQLWEFGEEIRLAALSREEGA